MIPNASISIVIRTYNEEKYLADLLRQIGNQDTQGIKHETIVVDSGSKDRTLQIAHEFNCKVVHIQKDQFSFGRSLNVGCSEASGNILVFISGHCIPLNREWLQSLVAPLGNDDIAYTYGGQIGNENSKFSECQIFSKYFPAQSKLPQEGFFCSNANAAILRDVWKQYLFDEDLTGLEDMHLAKRLVGQRMKIGYVSEACVYHLHNETWFQIKRRFEREAIALQYIMPEIHVSFVDFIRYASSAIALDVRAVASNRMLLTRGKEIFLCRLMQFWGVYCGNHFHRKLSKKRKEAYFYPR